MKIIVCGTRGLDTDELYTLFLDAFDSLTSGHSSVDEILHGECPNSPDRFAIDLALADGFKVTSFPADWGAFGKFAGYKRNAEMAKYVASSGDDAFTIAVWDGKSNGTKNMIEESTKAGIPVYIVPAKIR